MTDTTDEPEVAYHLLIEPAEAAIAVRALHLLISDEAHEPGIRALARESIDLLETPSKGGEPAATQAGERGEADAARAGQATATVPLTAPQMKILHTAARLMLLDTQRDQEDERELLRSILDKLPDDHAIRAIEIE